MDTILYFRLIEHYGNKIQQLTFFVNLLDILHFFIASGADDLDEGLLVCSQSLKTQIPAGKTFVLHINSL